MAMLVPFPLKTWHADIPILITPKRLLRRIRKGGKDNYGLITSATALVKTCSLPNFPQEIATEIEDSILECFTNLTADGGYIPTRQERTNETAVWFCYCHSKNFELREQYLREVIKSSIILSYGDLGLLFFHGPEHDEFECHFIKERISELHRAERHAEKNETVNYLSWQKSLPEKYQKAYDEAVGLGRFKSDYAQRDKLLFSLNGGR